MQTLIFWNLPAPRRNLEFAGTWFLAYGLLPGLALLLAVGAAYLKDQVGLASESGIARIESVAAAKESTIALLSYKPETVREGLGGSPGPDDRHVHRFLHATDARCGDPWCQTKAHFGGRQGARREPRCRLRRITR